MVLWWLPCVDIFHCTFVVVVQLDPSHCTLPFLLLENSILSWNESQRNYFQDPIPLFCLFNQCSDVFVGDCNNWYSCHVFRFSLSDGSIISFPTKEGFWGCSILSGECVIMDFLNPKVNSGWFPHDVIIPPDHGELSAQPTPVWGIKPREGYKRYPGVLLLVPILVKF